MADRELRHMRRTELVEIIFALKQSEDQLKAENADLTAKLEQRQIHLDSAGSIAQAALELNHVFEAAPMTIWLRCGRSIGTPCRRRQKSRRTRSWHRPGPRRNS